MFERKKLIKNNNIKINILLLIKNFFFLQTLNIKLNLCNIINKQKII